MRFFAAALMVLCGDNSPPFERDDDATPRRIRTNFGVMCMHVSALIVDNNLILYTRLKELYDAEKREEKTPKREKKGSLFDDEKTNKQKLRRLFYRPKRDKNETKKRIISQ